MTLISLPAGPFTRATPATSGCPRQIAELGAVPASPPACSATCTSQATYRTRSRCGLPPRRCVVVPGAVFVDRTAAWLHGVDVLDYRELEVLPPVECVVLRGPARASNGPSASAGSGTSRRAT